MGERGDLKILFFAYRKIINLIFENITIWIVVFVFFFILSGPPQCFTSQHYELCVNTEKGAYGLNISAREHSCILQFDNPKPFQVILRPLESQVY